MRSSICKTLFHVDSYPLVCEQFHQGPNRSRIPELAQGSGGMIDYIPFLILQHGDEWQHGPLIT